MKILAMSSEKSVATAALPGFETPDVISDSVAMRDAKERIFKLVKRLFESTSSTTKIMESLNRKRKQSALRTEKINKLKENIMLRIKRYEEVNNSLKDTYEKSKRDIQSAIRKSLGV